MNSCKTHEWRKHVGIQENPSVALADYIAVLNNPNVTCPPAFLHCYGSTVRDAIYQTAR